MMGGKLTFALEKRDTGREAGVPGCRGRVGACGMLHLSWPC